MKMKLLIVSCGLGIIYGAPALSDTMTGSINVRLTLTPGCQVNNQTSSAGMNLGSLDFGSRTTVFTDITATLAGPSGNAIYVKCSVGQTYNVQVTGSSPKPTEVHGLETTQARYMIRTDNPSIGLAYTIYSDIGQNTPIADNTNLRDTGIPDGTLGDVYLINGRIRRGPGDNGNGIPPGAYADTISVAVNY